MISDHTKLAIIALINIDACATEPERERVRLALTGTRPHGRTIPLKEAQELLGLSRGGLRKWIDAGRLVGVKGSGSRYYGVTEESLARV